MAANGVEAEGGTAREGAVDHLRRSAKALVADGHGSVAVADALVQVAAEFTLAKLGRAGCALWLRDVFDDVRFGRP